MLQQTQLMDIDQLRSNALVFDTRRSRLGLIIEGLNKAAIFLQEEELGIDWWQTMNGRQEFESIYRLAVLAFEDYIVNTIKELFEDIEDYSFFYRLEPHIDLIITLAGIVNSLENVDSEVLKSFNLKVDHYPLYNGVKILSKNRNLEEIIPTLKKWRIKLIDLKYPIDTG